jgi:hypothetical protein
VLNNDISSVEYTVLSIVLSSVGVVLGSMDDAAVLYCWIEVPDVGSKVDPLKAMIFGIIDGVGFSYRTNTFVDADVGSEVGSLDAMIIDDMYDIYFKKQVSYTTLNNFCNLFVDFTETYQFRKSTAPILTWRFRMILITK